MESKVGKSEGQKSWDGPEEAHLISRALDLGCAANAFMSGFEFGNGVTVVVFGRR